MLSDEISIPPGKATSRVAFTFNVIGGWFGRIQEESSPFATLARIKITSGY